MDPRVHCALVCGAKSCPPIRVYSAGSLDVGLEAAAEAFCEEVQLQAGANRVTLSKIFLWYAGDFGGGGAEVLRWIAPRLASPRRETLEAMLDAEAAGGEPVTLDYAAYDWGINSK
jgi:hypothetical protein